MDRFTIYPITLAAAMLTLKVSPLPAEDKPLKEKTKIVNFQVKGAT
jgi:hypothetical protein